MKKTIIILIILCINYVSFGQVKLHNENEGLLYQGDTLPISGFSSELSRPIWNDNHSISISGKLITNSYPQDTIPVIMQVSDTTTNDTTTYFDKAGGKYHKHLFYADYSVYWIKGYAVFEKHNSVEGQVIYNTKDYYEYKIFKQYLDENRNPLSKNIIVWQSK